MKLWWVVNTDFIPEFSLFEIDLWLQVLGDFSISLYVYNSSHSLFHITSDNFWHILQKVPIFKLIFYFYLQKGLHSLLIWFKVNMHVEPDVQRLNFTYNFFFLCNVVFYNSNWRYGLVSTFVKQFCDFQSTYNNRDMDLIIKLT